MVCEKAFATLHGSYEAIGRGGLVGAALEALTGGHGRSASPRSLPWGALRAAAEEATRFAGCGTRSDLCEDRLQGLVGGHAYLTLALTSISNLM